MSLVLGDPNSFEDVKQAFASLQTWAATVQLAIGNYKSDGFASFLGQYRTRLTFSGFSIPDSTEQPITFTSVLNDDIFEWDIGDLFDGTNTFWLSEPGFYLAVGRLRWDNNAAGTLRTVQLRVAGDDSEFATYNPPVALMTQYVVGWIPVTTEIKATISGGRVPVILEAFQDSGGTRTVTGWFSVTKVA